jgi:hypothetical protein
MNQWYRTRRARTRTPFSLARLTRSWRTRHPDRGQATAEYALVLLGAAMVALILIGWATGGGVGKIGGLLDGVIDAVTGSF